MATLKSERAILKDVGAKPHPNSGRGQFKKGDGSDDMFVIDVKEAAKSFTLNMGVWKKICSDSYKTDPYKHPQLLIVFGEYDKKYLSVIETDVLNALQSDIRFMAEQLGAAMKELNELRGNDNS